jgi:lipopolysaccharide transport system permease protein
MKRRRSVALAFGSGACYLPADPLGVPMLALIDGALADIRTGLRMRRVWMALAQEDIGDSHKRTRLGPIWLLLNYLLFVITLLFIFGEPRSNYPIYVAFGLLAWNFISETVMQSVQLFFTEQAFIKGTVLPLFVYVMRQTMRTTIRAGYGLIGAIMIIVFFGHPPASAWLYALPAAVLLILTAPAVSIILAILGTLMPDVNFFIMNFMRLAFFLTPVFWYPAKNDFRQALYDWNPMTHYIDIFRNPIVDGVVPVHSWQVTLAASILLWVVAVLLLGVYRRKIVFLL